MGSSGSSSSGTTVIEQRLPSSSPDSHSTTKQLVSDYRGSTTSEDLPPLKSSLSTEQSSTLAKSVSCKGERALIIAVIPDIFQADSPSGPTQFRLSQAQTVRRPSKYWSRVPLQRSLHPSSSHQTSTGPLAQAAAVAVCDIRPCARPRADEQRQ